MDFKQIFGFMGNDLSKTIRDCEDQFSQKPYKNNLKGALEERKIDRRLLDSCFEAKKMFSQINTIIHSVGILVCLPNILAKNEEVCKLSLGAGNTGKAFDLETNMRVAEFKFIDWKGGPESIRQNGVFKDFFTLAESETTRKKELYIFCPEIVMKFFNGNRSISSVTSKDTKLRDIFATRYKKLKVVSDYYNLKKRAVSILDLEQFLKP